MGAGRPGVVVIIPTLNEEESIGQVVGVIPRDLVDRVIVADGGSDDRTADRARDAGAEVLGAGRGYGRACLEASRRAAEGDILVFMDGDGADDPASMGAMIGPILSGRCDLVIGSRTRGRREAGSMAWHQVAAGWLAGRMIRALYGVAYSDMCAYRAIRRGTLDGLGMRELTYGWNLEMQMRAARAGMRVLEIPVANRRRIGGASKVAGSLRGSLVAGARIVATFARVAAERSAPARSPATDDSRPR